MVNYIQWGGKRWWKISHVHLILHHLNELFCLSPRAKGRSAGREPSFTIWFPIHQRLEHCRRLAHDTLKDAAQPYHSHHSLASPPFSQGPLGSKVVLNGSVKLCLSTSSSALVLSLPAMTVSRKTMNVLHKLDGKLLSSAKAGKTLDVIKI